VTFRRELLSGVLLTDLAVPDGYRLSALHVDFEASTWPTGIGAQWITVIGGGSIQTFDAGTADVQRAHATLSSAAGREPDAERGRLIGSWHDCTPTPRSTSTCSPCRSGRAEQPGQNFETMPGRVSRTPWRLRLRGEGGRTGRRTGRKTEMKYLLMIYGNQEKWDSIPADEFPEMIARQEAFNRKYRDTGELLGAYGLSDIVAARLVRRVDGLPAVTDGPYLETKEYIASFYLLDCADQARAEQIAADIPLADQDPVELWPILHESPVNDL
jgi:hypothetical protein